MIITIILGLIKVRIPNTDRIQKKSNIEATVCKGRGKIPIAQLITKSISTSHKVTK